MATKLAKDRAHVRVNRSGVLRDHVKNANKQPGDQMLVGMESTTIRKALSAYKIRVEKLHDSRGGQEKVLRSDGKMVPVYLVTFL